MRLLYIAAIVCFTFVAPTLCTAQAAAQRPAQAQDNRSKNLTAAQQSNANVGPTTENMAPQWPELQNASHNKFLNELLDYWQKKSDEVKRYQCEFTRYDYDTTFCNWRDPNTNRLAAAAIMTGEIRFAAPDQACYETTKVFDFGKPPEQAGQDPTYVPRDEVTNREKWICDGKSIYEFDIENKKLYETAIPAEMQGNGLINSPIPFLFGASKDDILNRFWVRVTTPEGTENEYWLEAVPKKIDDARNYKKLELVLSRDELFLPIMLHVYAPNYNPKENNLTSRVFEFKNRKVNSTLSGIQKFLKWFVRPHTPVGWERVNRTSLQAQQHFDPATLNRPAQIPGTTQIK